MQDIPKKPLTQTEIIKIEKAIEQFIADLNEHDQSNDKLLTWLSSDKTLKRLLEIEKSFNRGTLDSNHDILPNYAQAIYLCLGIGYLDKKSIVSFDFSQIGIKTRSNFIASCNKAEKYFQLAMTKKKSSLNQQPKKTLTYPKMLDTFLQENSPNYYFLLLVIKRIYVFHTELISTTNFKNDKKTLEILNHTKTLIDNLGKDTFSNETKPIYEFYIHSYMGIYYCYNKTPDYNQAKNWLNQAIEIGKDIANKGLTESKIYPDPYCYLIVYQHLSKIDKKNLDYAQAQNHMTTALNIIYTINNLPSYYSELMINLYALWNSLTPKKTIEFMLTTVGKNFSTTLTYQTTTTTFRTTDRPFIAFSSKDFKDNLKLIAKFLPLLNANNQVYFAHLYKLIIILNKKSGNFIQRITENPDEANSLLDKIQKVKAVFDKYFKENPSLLKIASNSTNTIVSIAHELSSLKKENARLKTQLEDTEEKIAVLKNEVEELKTRTAPSEQSESTTSLFAHSYKK